ncbi:hypothetical protein [Desulfonatronum sp. SC1]|uniref:hypothetical protein n=1 Tax=Desulfonatronum sp. SC1 TaxID=2109626 RepID=UPI000D309FA0|nr:hypothetical protein [Desulfonatronum sp. SC1]PTN35137.1 hypothetical protein C6366_11495 [Desulfonatronum sp. SC1]
MMKRSLSPSMVLNVVFFTGFLVLAWGTWSSYDAWTDASPGNGEERADVVSAMLSQELRLLFPDPSMGSAQYAIVTDKNLFSSERRAWSPPPSVAGDAPQAEPQAQTFLPDTTGIRLYGTSIVPDRKTALVYFERFASRQKHRILEEGETARDEGERGESFYFVLKKLEQDSVVLVDAQGREHVIGLYEHMRTEPPRGPQQSTRMNAQSAPSATAGENEPVRRVEDIPESLEERERLAKEGRLRRISTPSGPVFQPVE